MSNKILPLLQAGFFNVIASYLPHPSGSLSLGISCKALVDLWNKMLQENQLQKAKLKKNLLKKLTLCSTKADAEKIINYMANHVISKLKGTSLYVQTELLPLAVLCVGEEYAILYKDQSFNKGAFKLAYKCLNSQGQNRCLLETNIKDNIAAKKYKKEISFLKLVDGKPGFLKTYAFFFHQSPKIQYVIQDLGGINLLDFYQQHEWQKLNFSEQLSSFKHCLLAVQFLHKNGIVHMDISLRNILYDKKATYLIDFGLSTYRNEPNGLCGTKELMPCDIALLAKEDLEKARLHLADFPNDIWKLGIIMGGLFFGAFPLWFKDKNNVEDQIRERAKTYVYPMDLPKETPHTLLRDLIYSMANRDAAKRPTIDQVIETVDKISLS